MRHRTASFNQRVRVFLAENAKIVLCLLLGGLVFFGALLAIENWKLKDRIEIQQKKRQATGKKLETCKNSLHSYAKSYRESDKERRVEKKAVAGQIAAISSLAAMASRRETLEEKLNKYEEEMKASLEELRSSQKNQNRQFWREFSKTQRKRDRLKNKLSLLDEKINNKLAKLDMEFTEGKIPDHKKAPKNIPSQKRLARRNKNN